MLKLSPERKALREYYKAYYNNNFLRNFRFIFDKEKVFDNGFKQQAVNLTSKKYGVHDTSDKKAVNFLLNHTRSRYGLLAGEITYYKTLDDFKEGAIEKRFCDRLFFDLDVNDSHEVDKLKEEFKLAHQKLEGKERAQIIDILQDDFKRLIFEKDLLLKVFNESKSLCDYLVKYGLKPYLIASGSKGFHVNVFFDEMQLTNLSQISQTLAMSYTKDLNLQYIDTNVFDKNKAHKRLQRAQYGVHSKTNLLTRPLPLDVTYDEMLDILHKNAKNPIKFDINEYKAPSGFNKMLLKLDKEISFKNAQRQKELESINKAKRLQLQKKYKGKYKNYNEIDLRDIANSYGIDGKHQSDRIIISCPFHNDMHPSAVVFKERFHCSTCNLTLNYYDFISRLEGTSDKAKIMAIASKFVK